MHERPNTNNSGRRMKRIKRRRSERSNSSSSNNNININIRISSAASSGMSRSLILFLLPLLQAISVSSFYSSSLLSSLSQSSSSLAVHRSFNAQRTSASVKASVAVAEQVAVVKNQQLRQLQQQFLQQQLELEQQQQDQQQRQQQPQQPYATTTTTVKKVKEKYSSRGKGTGLHLPYQSAIQVLKTYHSQHGHLVIPRRYTVPSTTTTSSDKSNNNSHNHNETLYPKEWHNLYLANTVYNMRWWTLYVKSNPDRVKELNSIGFVWERLQPEWNLVLEALIVYKSLNGHMKVPASFVVPDFVDSDGNDDVNDDDGIDNDNNTAGNDKNVWPKATWGIQLGNCVHRIRTRGDFLRDEDVAWSRRRQLDGLDFIWDVQEYAFSKFFHALKIYSKLEQQQQLHIRQVRQQQQRQRQVHQQQQRQAQLNSNGNINTNSNSNSILRSGGDRRLQYYYYQRSKVLRVPQNFVIPSTPTIALTLPTEPNNSNNGGSQIHHIPNPYPKELYNYPLGIKCTAVRQKLLYIKHNPERRRALQDIGFQISTDGSDSISIGWLNIVWASSIYSKIHGRGTLDVPVHFVVPSLPSLKNDDSSSTSSSNSNSILEHSYSYNEGEYEWPWPEQLWGFPLGQRLKDVRLKGAHLKNAKSAPARRAQLDGLGFVWHPKRGRRKRSLGG